MQAYDSRGGLPVRKCGAVVVARTETQQQSLSSMVDKARRNGVRAVTTLTASELQHQFPALVGLCCCVHTRNNRVVLQPKSQFGGLWIPGECIADPLTVPLVLLEEARALGVRLVTNARVHEASFNGAQVSVWLICDFLHCSTAAVDVAHHRRGAQGMSCPLSRFA